ncbi:hypothetical protein Pcinc_032895 [Petrolisthes cinctipes]|uniref:Uncharacterized protein n=1 Tax=Petrolisthes cinctipes TaxID=88211 RepID=A0AAE1ETK3_PETCI|nr:hypothetical protein Pcinc_032895 [Petrolisthes cinctipes]
MVARVMALTSKGREVGRDENTGGGRADRSGGTRRLASLHVRGKQVSEAPYTTTCPAPRPRPPGLRAYGEPVMATGGRLRCGGRDSAAVLPCLSAHYPSQSPPFTPPPSPSLHAPSSAPPPPHRLTCRVVASGSSSCTTTAATTTTTAICRSYT